MATDTCKQANVDNSENSSVVNKSSSKKKFTLYNELDALIPGRHKCDCEASIHELICNCLNCGRIVCAQENVGSCFTCGEYVYSKHEIEEMTRRTKYFDEQKEKKRKDEEKIKKQGAPMNLKEIASSLIDIEEATEHRDKLLEFQRTSEKRTKVIDDEMDYFDLTKENWLSNEKREELKERVDKLHEDKFEVDRRFELDFASRQVVEVCIPKVKNLGEEISKLKEETEFKSDYEEVDFRQILANEPELHPFFVENNQNENRTNEQNTSSKTNKKTMRSKKEKKIDNKFLPSIDLARNRLQNSDLFDSTDEGHCISINQPWASLLVHQIKLHEGRSWFTSHRGPTWIHASAKSPRKEEIEEACNLFKLMIGDDIQFPKHYPLGSIIGRANLIDCFNQEEYRSKFGNNSYLDDAYVFVFDNVIKLEVTVPANGSPKIYKLDKTTFKAVSSQINVTYGTIKQT